MQSYEVRNVQSIHRAKTYKDAPAGPVVGGLFPPGNNRPLAVNKVYYDKVCPKPVIYRPQNVHDRISDHCVRSAKVIADDWVAKLESSESRCIQSDPGSGPLFNHR